MSNVSTKAPPPEGPPAREPPANAPANARPPTEGPRASDQIQGGQRVLRRTRDGKIAAGVCAGLGRYLGLDPLLLRLAFVVLTLANGVGLLLYVIAAIVIPPERPGESTGPAQPPDAATGRLVVGGVLVAAGAMLLLDQLTSVTGRVLWPLAVAAIGVAVLLKGVQR
jgi:phage shock protein C